MVTLIQEPGPFFVYNQSREEIAWVEIYARSPSVKMTGQRLGPEIHPASFWIPYLAEGLVEAA
jgi:hypothetical protein